MATTFTTQNDLGGTAQYISLFISEHDRAELMATINERYKLPPPPQVPESIPIKLGVFQGGVVFDSEGVEFRKWIGTKRYTWHEVEEIHITRCDAVRRDFQRLDMKFSDGRWAIPEYTRGPTKAEINEFLFRHAADSIHVSILGEPLQKISVVKETLRQQESTRKVFLVGSMALLIVCSAMPFFCILEENAGPNLWWQRAIFSVFLLVLIGPITLGYFPINAKCKQLKERLKTLEEPVRFVNGSQGIAR